MKYFSYIPAGLIVLLLFAVGCRKDTLGPSLVEMHGPVTVTEPFSASKNSVDFSKNEQVHFTAKFENDAAWIVTVKGQISGAVKTFEGASKSVDISNSVWTGYANTIPSFQVEPVTATLSFKYTADTFKTTINATGLRDLDKNAVLITDFSHFKFIHQWDVDANHNLIKNADWKYIDTAYKAFPKADGGVYCTMVGHPWVASNMDPYINYLDLTSINPLVQNAPYYPLPADSNSVYFNVMVYGTGTASTRLLINFQEDHITCRHADIAVNWEGWKLLSYRYADLLDNVTTPNQPNKITMVSFVLLSSATGPYPGDKAYPTPPTNKPFEDKNPFMVGVAFDHPIFTLHTPYQP